MFGGLFRRWTHPRVELTSILDRFAVPGVHVLISGPARARDIVDAACRVGKNGRIIRVDPDLNHLEATGRLARKEVVPWLAENHPDSLMWPSNEPRPVVGRNRPRL